MVHRDLACYMPCVAMYNYFRFKLDGKEELASRSLVNLIMWTLAIRNNVPIIITMDNHEED